jgi:hypothetical protein
MDDLGVTLNVRLAAGPGRLTFSPDGTRYHGTQRIVARARRGAIRVVVTELVRYRGTRI